MKQNIRAFRGVGRVVSEAMLRGFGAVKGSVRRSVGGRMSEGGCLGGGVSRVSKVFLSHGN